MSKQQRPRNNRKASVSDGLDQLADLASAVANSVHGSAQDLDSQESQMFSAFATYPNTGAIVPLSKQEHQKSSLPTSLTKGYSNRRGNVVSFRELENAISSRRLGLSEHSPLLPLHNIPDEYEAAPRQMSNGRVAWLAAGSAILVCALFLCGLWLSDEIVSAWRAVETTIA